MLCGVAAVLVLDLLVLPWFSFGATISVGSATVSIGGSPTAVDAPDAFLGVLALLATAFLLADLATERLSPHTRLPTSSATGSRAASRSPARPRLIAFKFVLHLGRFGELALGFWLGLLLVAALVALTRRARLEATAAQVRTARRPPSRARTRLHGQGTEPLVAPPQVLRHSSGHWRRLALSSDPQVALLPTGPASAPGIRQ